MSPPSLKRRRASPAEHPSMIPQSAQQPTSLPSIRQLHPYLPPSSGVSQSLSPEIPAYGYPGPSPYSPMVAHAEPPPSHPMGASQRDPAIVVNESEADDLELQNPPKKKRRRQALSCTGDLPFLLVHSLSSDLLDLFLSFLELGPSPLISILLHVSISWVLFSLECKRRKIKCDRYFLMLLEPVMLSR